MSCLKMWTSANDECATGCGCRCAELALTAHLDRSPRLDGMMSQSRMISHNSGRSSDSGSDHAHDSSDETNSSASSDSNVSDSDPSTEDDSEHEENIDMYS